MYKYGITSPEEDLKQNMMIVFEPLIFIEIEHISKHWLAQYSFKSNTMNGIPCLTKL